MPPIAEKVLERIDSSGGPDACWPSDFKKTGKGYRLVYLGGGRRAPKATHAHRLVYEILVGPIPPGMTIDHRCHNDDPSCRGGPACPHRACCNPKHLAVAPAVDNARIGITSRATCRRGHPRTPENLSAEKVGAGRVASRCTACRREREARYRAARSG